MPALAVRDLAIPNYSPVVGRGAEDRPSRYGGRGFNGCQLCRARASALAVRDLAIPNYSPVVGRGAEDRPSRYGGRGFNGCQLCRARASALAVRDLAIPNYSPPPYPGLCEGQALALRMQRECFVPRGNYLMTTIFPTLFRRVSPWRAVNL